MWFFDCGISCTLAVVIHLKVVHQHAMARNNGAVYQVAVGHGTLPDQRPVQKLFLRDAVVAANAVDVNLYLVADGHVVGFRI